MSLDTGIGAVELMAVTGISETMFLHAREVVSQHSHNVEEFDQFMAMLTPEAWRCAYCDTHYGVPSLARDCEARCEKEKKR